MQSDIKLNENTVRGFSWAESSAVILGTAQLDSKNT